MYLLDINFFFNIFFHTGCEKDVQRVWLTSSQEYIHPFKEKMEAFISNGKPCIKLSEQISLNCFKKHLSS